MNNSAMEVGASHEKPVIENPYASNNLHGAKTSMDTRCVSAKTISFPLKNNGSVSERSYSNNRKDYSPSGKRIDKNASQFSLSHEPENLR